MQACARRVLRACWRNWSALSTAATHWRLNERSARARSAPRAFNGFPCPRRANFGPTLQGPGLNEVEYTPDGARRTLLRHSQLGERWTLVSVRAGDGPSWHGGVDAEVHFARKLANGQVVKTGGKTALSCVGSAIYVLSLGDEKP